jgi:glycosyltransferase involved in cell wall biosynthesis
MAATCPAESVLSCTIVICTHNRPKELDRCLAAVRKIIYPDFGVLVVDNAPEDGQTQVVAQRWGVRYVWEPVAGLSRARNLGALACDSDFVAYLDDDAVPTPDWLHGLAREFRDPRVMAVTGRTLELKVRAAGACSAQYSPYSPDVLGTRKLVVDQGFHGWFEMANFGGIGQGGNMAFRRGAFAIWNGFDQRLGRGALIYGSEEHYAFFSLIDNGYRVVYTPRAIVHHPCARDAQEIRARHIKDLAASTGYFTFLLFEQPRYRGAVLRYVFQGILGVRRSWRLRHEQIRIVPPLKRLLTCLYGPLLYLQACSKLRPLSTGMSRPDEVRKSTTRRILNWAGIRELT